MPHSDEHNPQATSSSFERLREQNRQLKERIAELESARPPRSAPGGADGGQQIGSLAGIVSDVAALGDTEDTRAFFQANLQMAQSRAQLGSWDYDPVKQTGFWSTEMYRLFGRDPESGLPRLEEFFEMIHPDDRARVRAAHDAAAQGQTHQAIDFQTNPEVCPKRYLSASIHRVQNGSTEDPILAGTVLDVTERKFVEAALRKSEQRYRSVVTALAEGVILYSKDLKVLTHNKSAERILGLTAEELIGRALPDSRWKTIHQSGLIFLPQDYPAVKTVQDGRPRYGVIMGVYTPEGDVRWLSVNTEPISSDDEADYAVVASFTDITQRTNALEALQRSEEHLNLALSAARAGTWEWDLLTGRVTWSPGSESLFGLQIGDFEGTFDNYFARVHPADRMFVRQVVDDMLRNLHGLQGHPGRIEHRVIWPDGTIRWLEIQGDVISAESMPGRVAGTIIDITDRKRAEEQLREQEVHLRHVGRLSSMGEMVAGIAHEVNQPLYSITNFAKACKNVLSREPIDVGRLREWNDQIEASTKRAADIIARLRGFSRRVESKISLVHVNELISDSLSMLAFDARRLHIHVSQSYGANLPKVPVEVVQVQQVLVNLLRNAYDAFGNTDTDDRHVRVEAVRDGDFVRISVLDNGPGLPDQQLNLFDAFVTTKHEGLGMGLAISQTIVDLHGGRIWADASKEGGASFHFTLPIAEALDAEALDAEALDEGPRAARRDTTDSQS